MGRLWTDADEARWQHVEHGADAQQSEATDPDDLLYRDVVTGCVRYAVAVVLHWLRLAGLPPRSLSGEIKAASHSRAFDEWLREPIEDPPGVTTASTES